MENDLIEGLRNWLALDDGINDSVRGNIFTNDGDRRSDLPLIICRNESATLNLDFTKNGLETYFVRIMIITDGEDIDAKNTTRNIELLILNYLKEYPQFPVAGYDRCLAIRRVPGVSYIDAFEDIVCSVNDPIYILCGNKI